MPSAFDWNRELSWIKEYRFPLDQGNQTVYECLKNWMDDYNRHIMTTTFMISEEKEQIKFFSDRLMQAYELYVDNRYIEAFNIFNQAMDSVKNHLPTAPVGRASAYVADAIPYYRIMAGNNKYNRLQFLHIPCNSRHLASANRFSVPGMPCSYMASAKRVAWYECKMPDSFQWAKFEAVKHDKKLIQLDLNPLTSTLSLISELPKERWTEDERKSFAREYCFILPLIASCSVIAKEKGKSFVEAYIIPQMLMIWIKNSTDYIGVRYYSSSDNELVRNDCGYNIAMPAKHPDKNGYCVDLQEIFGVNDTNKTDEMEFLDFTEKFYNHHKVQIDRLETFYKEILYTRQHTHYHKQGILYERYCSVCKVLIALIKAFRTEKGSSRYALVMSLSEAWYLCMDIQDLTSAKFEKIKKENTPGADFLPDDTIIEIENDIDSFKNTVIDLAHDFNLFVTVGIT